jgi:hypothetical protein
MWNEKYESSYFGGGCLLYCCYFFLSTVNIFQYLTCREKGEDTSQCMSGLEECAQFWELQNKKNVRLEEVQSIERIMEIK